MSDPCRVRCAGPLVSYVDGFRVRLAGERYGPDAATAQLQLMAHVSRWLAGRGLTPCDLSAGRVVEFVEARRADGYAHLLSSCALGPLLGHLRGLGVVPVPAVASPSPLECLLEDYRHCLVAERGLASSTVARFVNTARRFLQKANLSDRLDVSRLVT